MKYKLLIQFRLSIAFRIITKYTIIVLNNDYTTNLSTISKDKVYIMYNIAYS